MRFKKKPKVNKGPYIGQKRVKTKFLFIPKTIGDETRWLERASYLQEYTPVGLSMEGTIQDWYDIKWLDDNQDDHRYVQCYLCACINCPNTYCKTGSCEEGCRNNNPQPKSNCPIDRGDE